MTSTAERGHIKETKIDVASKTLAVLRLAVLQAILTASEVPPITLPHKTHAQMSPGGAELQSNAKLICVSWKIVLLLRTFTVAF